MIEAAFLELSDTEVSKVSAAIACTRSGYGFCIPKTLCGEPFPVSTQIVNNM